MVCYKIIAFSYVLKKFCPIKEIQVCILSEQLNFHEHGGSLDMLEKLTEH